MWKLTHNCNVGLKQVIKQLGSDIELRANFHQSAYTEDDFTDDNNNETGFRLMPHQNNREGQPTLTEFVWQIYNQVTSTMKCLMKNTVNQNAIKQLERFNQQIKEHNQTHHINAKNHIIKYFMLKEHYDIAASLVRNLKHNSADNLLKSLLKQINEVLNEVLEQRFYFKTWLVNNPSQGHAFKSNSNQRQASLTESSFNQRQAPFTELSFNQKQALLTESSFN